MRQTSCYSMLAGCLALVLTLATLGCGDSDSQQSHDQPPDQVSLAGLCADTCITMADCAPWLDEAQQNEHMDVCQQHCNDPMEHDVELRDCTIACDLELDCEDYFACLCACGMQGVCF
jgi:hypothetical protein